MFSRVCKITRHNLLDVSKMVLIPTPKRNHSDQAVVPVTPLKTHNLDPSLIPVETKLTRKDAFVIYENMMLIRRMENEAANLYKAKKIYGFCHLYAGTEAVGTGICAAMQDMDDLITSYRCHGFVMLFARKNGRDGPKLVLSELAGKVDGVMKGKGGSMHMYVPPRFYGGQGIVGGQVPLGVGLGFAHKYKENGGVAHVLYGDGAANQGQVFESFNIASLHKLPVVFVCENNEYGMGTACNRSSATTNYYAAGRIIPGIKVDGMDVITVREVTKIASDLCRKGKGPIIIEMDAYRYFGHSMSDPGISYRTREEVQEVRKKRDPIEKFKKLMIDTTLATEEELSKIDKSVKQICADAKKAAEESAMPDPNTLLEDIYVKPIGNTRKCTPIG